MAKKYIHVNQHKIRSNLKHGTNEPNPQLKKDVITHTVMK